MGELHYRLQFIYPNLTFIYIPFGSAGGAYTFEVTRVPNNFVRAPHKYATLWIWFRLRRLNPQAVLVSGNFPRANLVAIAWAFLYNRDLYYLADSNLLDKRNLQQNWFIYIINRFIFRRAKRILCIGARNREYYLKYIQKSELDNVIVAFPLPHLHEKFESVLHSPKESFDFLVVCRLEKVKAVDQVIKAFSMLSGNYLARSRLKIVGDGSSRELLERQAQMLGLKDKVEFLGSIASDKMPDIYASANVLVVASSDEPWGLVVNEAMSVGLPVVGPFWIGSFADLVVNGETGFITLTNDPKDLSVAMEALVKDPKCAQRMGIAGRERMRRYQWNIDSSVEAFGKLPIFASKKN